MSCPSSLKSAGDIFSNDDECVDVPNEYYIYTALMITLVVGIPLLYRQIWITVWSLFRYYRRPTELRGGPAGCRPVGKLGHRNLSKESNLHLHSNGHANGMNGHAGGGVSGRIEALFVYPIKSCYPIELPCATITETGIEYDRQFCFAQWHEPTATAYASKENAPKKGSSAYWDSRPHWEFMTQRQNPSLTHLKVQIWRPDPNLRDYSEKDENVESGGCLIVSFDYAPPLTSIRNIWSVITAKVCAMDMSAVPRWTFQVPLNPSLEQIKERKYASENVRVWRDEVGALDMTSEIPHHILKVLDSLFLEDVKRRSAAKYARMKSSPLTLRLFRVDDSLQRGVYKCAPTRSQLGYQAHTGYQDSYPIHIQNMASIADVERHIPQDKVFKPDSRRFRANIYVSGPPKYDEDDWTLVSLGDSKLHVSCRTTRCKLPTNDPDSGVLGSDVQPYNYLVKNRSIDDGAPNTGCLGMMCVPTKDAVGTTIKVGDDLAVLKRGQHHFIADAEPEAQTPVL